jgi:hypothetical protein
MELQKGSKKEDFVFQPQLSLLCFRAVILLRHCIFFATGVSFLRSGENPILRRPGAGFEPGTLQIHLMGHSRMLAQLRHLAPTLKALLLCCLISFPSVRRQ